MTKTERLNLLFERWLKEFPDYKGKFKKDGIIDEKSFQRQEPKLLFIAKEPNDPSQNKGDFREWWSRKVDYSFSHRICEWAYGLLNGFPALTDLKYDNQERVQVMKSIAFMNVKKIGGEASASYDAIRNVILSQRHLTQKEIEIVEPDIIIGGVRGTEFWELVFPDAQFMDSGFDVKVARSGSSRLVDFYHPSYRVPRSMSYSLLQNIVESQVFSNL